MHSFSYFFLLHQHHHHFDDFTTSSDCISISSGSIYDENMSDQSDVEFEPSNIDEPEQILSNEITEVERDNTRSDSTINPIDEESQFIFDDEMNRLICVGTTFSDIPHSIVDAYASKTKVRQTKT